MFDSKNFKSCSNKHYKCSIELALDIIGGKWKPLILWQLKDKILRFGELKRTLNDVTQKMLTQHLRELETDGLVNRHVYAQVPPKVEYSLTEQGSTVIPILEMISNWGTAQCSYTNTHNENSED